MLVALAAIAVFAGLAALVVRWAESDYAEGGELGTRSTVGGWLLYLFHADSVATAAYAGALRVDALPAAVAWGLAAAIGGAGIGLFAAAVSGLAQVAGGEPRLQTRGAFRLMRHPQNVGWGLLLLGVAVAGRSLLAVALVAMFALFVERYSRVEEAHLERRFGEAWRAYRRRTPAALGLRRPAGG